MGPPRNPRKNIIVGLMESDAVRPTPEQLLKAGWHSLPWLDFHGYGSLFDAWQARHTAVNIKETRKFRNAPVVCVPAALGRCCARVRL